MEELSQQQKDEQEFANVCAELTALHTKKNHDYGNSFGNTSDKLAKKKPEYAVGYQLGMLSVKVDRILQLSAESAWVKDESIEDSLKDLASYAIMTLVERRKNKK